MEKELILKAKECKSVEEILTLAKENGVELTEEQAKEYFAKMNPANGELADDELDNVAGGSGEEEEKYCSRCGGKMERIVISANFHSGEVRYAWLCRKCDRDLPHSQFI